MKKIIVILCALAGTVHAAGTIFSTVLSGLGEDFASAVTSDAQGNTYVVGLTYSPDFPVTPGAYQTTLGLTDDAFVAKIGPDGKVIWATYLGGILDDFATGVAVDSSGNVWVTGYTRSANFPLVNPIQNTQNGFVAFVTEFDPTGSKLLYSTFLGGMGETGGAGIVLDSAGNVYIAANTLGAAGYPGIQTGILDPSGIVVTKLTSKGALVYSYLYPNGIAQGLAVDSTGAVYVAGSNVYDPSSTTKMFGPTGTQNAIVFKLSPDGSAKIFDTGLGGSVSSAAAAVAVDSSGEVWVAGSTASADFPLVNPLQSSLGSRPLWKSTDSGATWTGPDNLPFALPQLTVVDPTTPTTIYEATGDLGVFKSVDGGATWKQASSGLTSGNIQILAINPVNPQVLFAASAPVYGATAHPFVAVYKSADGANSWTQVDSPIAAVTAIEVDAQNPNLVYEVENNPSFGSGPDIRKSTDGGNTWNPVTFPEPLQSMVLDPHVSGVLIAVSYMTVSGPNGVGVNAPPFLFRSVDGGATWTQNPTVTPSGGPGLVVDGSTTPATVYDGLAFRSSDAGVTWTALPSSAVGTSPTALAVDPSGTLYASNGTGVFVSHDHGQTFTAIGSPYYPNVASIVPVGSGGTLFANIADSQGSTGLSPGIDTFFPMELNTSGFVSKLSADGQTLEYSTYLRGHPATNTGPIFTSQPAVIQTQNWISGIALDASGNVVVAGGTRATDFPTVNPAQAANAGRADAFAAILFADGSKLNYSTYFGGSQDDGALAAAIDSTGNVIVAGQTFSPDFPGLQPPYGLGDAFVVKLATGTPAISSVLNGASFQPGIEAGSWAMITGVNLANTTRTWQSSDFSGDNLPTSLSGVSVTIDGKPAFLSYISPTQINVQAPSDTNLGTVNAIVNNNGVISAPATAQLQTYAPAFFIQPGTSFVFASLLPNYTPISSTAPASPGDLVALWGTGFGPTTPQAPAGTIVSGVPFAPTPTITVGGVSVPVLNSVLTQGSVGLYQITIQLPANVPTGPVAIQASIGGAQTQAGAMILIGQ
jgi:uncharacterized protein (TIGR03437 family)